MINLFPFQEEAAAQVADRYLDYLEDPPQTGTVKRPRAVPFFQALSALTGAGKTAILGRAVSQMAAAAPQAPIVLWLSKGRVVVRQSLANLSKGGKYHHLLDEMDVITLDRYTAAKSAEAPGALLCFATVGTFNQKDKELSSLNVFSTDFDDTETSIWESLKVRLDAKGKKRPLFVVYDEAHNFSDQQANLLMELQPDAFLLASATMKLPSRIGRELDDLRRNGWTEDRLITSVDARVVVESGLVKQMIDLAGYNAPMEETISSMLDDMSKAEQDVASSGLQLVPKAIYVCNTNVVADDSFAMDDPRQPFPHRQAPPILIWRYLVEQCGVEPSKIAVYASLRTHKDHPLPEEFVLFQGGENDYERFSAGDYQHIIFNLGLQEGWDDPSVYFAYVDKSMDSNVQVTQVIGRVLRQPNASRTSYERLNRANFYVRVDRNETFNQVLKEVQTQLGAGGAGLKIVVTEPGKARPREYPAKLRLEVPMTGLDGRTAVDPVNGLIAKFGDYRQDTVNVIGKGSRRVVRQEIGNASSVEGDWVDFEQSAKVSGRWIFHREVQRRFRQALAVVDLTNSKFNVLAGIGSPVFAQFRDLAERVVEAYIREVRLVQRTPDPYIPREMLMRDEEIEPFENSLHEGYSGLNGLELIVAPAIDKLGLPWMRNPSLTGYGIPLVSVGPTSKFFPDFLIWTEKRVLCIDTKGHQLIQETAGRKLLNIRPKPGAERSLDVRFVSVGKLNDSLQVVDPEAGFSLWGLNDQGQIRTSHFESVNHLLERLVDDKLNEF
ncbi:hypothetical protein NicSoilE8_41490 (plasmid) [Arthrobacter sp. NicSoilE8]|nr:hypothetical protein NicSoilE8_41490 [Arthrobacter sp. NicSoilE8]